MTVIILLALLATAILLINHPTTALPESYRSPTVEETLDNSEEFTATAVITITMTPVKD